MILQMANVLLRVKIALVVTAMASALQAIYQPSKVDLYGPMGQELTTYLLFGLLKVIGFLVLSLLCARALYPQRAIDNNLRKADTFLFAMMMGTLLLAVYVFAGMRFIESEAFIGRWGAGIPQNIAAATMFAVFLAASIPYYKRQCYDIAVIVNVGTDELTAIKGNSRKNSQFINTLILKFSLFFLPLFGLHILLLVKISADKHFSIVTPFADALVTCAMALTFGYAVAITLRAMSDEPVKSIR